MDIMLPIHNENTTAGRYELDGLDANASDRLDFPDSFIALLPHCGVFSTESLVLAQALSGASHRETAMLAPPQPQPPRPMRANDSGAGGIEIVLANGARISVDAFVNEKALSRVLRAMKGAT